MADWYPLLQSIFIGLLFSYLIAKLISVVVALKEDNISITRDPNTSATKPGEGSRRVRSVGRDLGGLAENDSVIAEQGSSRSDSVAGSGDDVDEDDDDWEGVESTELDEVFSAATAFVAASAADRMSQKVPNDVQLQLYGLYKIATEGPCTAPQPSAIKMTARAKWQAWQKLGAMPPEDAMQSYIDIVTELYPTWLDGSAVGKARDKDASRKYVKESMGPVFSSFVHEEESGNDLKMDAIHAFAREGEVANLLNCIQGGVSVNQKDSEGRTPLHWAVDRGHLKVVEVLVDSNVDVNAKDNEGQTALHYAVVCDREAIAEFLVDKHADAALKDNEDKSPCDLCESEWPWMRKITKKE